MESKNEILKLLKRLKEMGHSRREIEERVGYADGGLDQALSNASNKERLLTLIKLYFEYAELKEQVGEDGLALHEPPVKYMREDKQQLINIIESQQRTIEALSGKADGNVRHSG